MGVILTALDMLLFEARKQGHTMQFSRNMLFIMSLLISLLIIFSAVSRFVQQFDPKSAFNINPLNARARLAYLTASLADEKARENQVELKEIVKKGLHIDPNDARFYSMLGLMAEAEGEKDFALGLYSHARRLIHTEQYALIRQLAHSISDKNNLQSAELVELIYLRWKTRWPLIEPLLPRLLQNEQIYQKLQAFFPTRLKGTNRIIASLLKSSDGMSIAKRLLTDWHKQGIGDLDILISHTNHALIAEGKIAAAYQLFYLTLDESQKKATGYVFNGSFDFDPSHDPFNWSIKNQSGVDIKIETLNPRSKEKRSLKISFSDKPTNLDNVSQNVRLPASKFILKVDYTNKNVKGPKPVILGIKCQKGRPILGEILLEKSNEDQQSRQVEFMVPAEGCDLQKISIYNLNFSKSWSNRYKGDMFINDVSIELSEE